ncbi:peptidyl-prolyl cis-trans isomerase SurA [Spirosoma oryzae]|uniref:Peptidyl-prolyl cis-trans isomerase SurA n=1 Tax=Spirosoma oryzae TaxID=1469603 RepID=A0A2T0SUF5_9BACT|nr:peptidylprolyl isomerase [Spirosoma oryzae]PRY37044.1 peptidyl-prolyl cis-trans isomerase SurA [Spirosoma oryzae]
MRYSLFTFTLYCLCVTTANAQWYSSETNNNFIHNDASAKKAIWSLYDSLQYGKPFATLALRYSQDPTSYRDGGTAKPILINDLVKEFQDVVRQLHVGQLSRPFKHEYGYSIIQLLEREDDTCLFRSILLRTD